MNIDGTTIGYWSRGGEQEAKTKLQRQWRVWWRYWEFHWEQIWLDFNRDWANYWQALENWESDIEWKEFWRQDVQERKRAAAEERARAPPQKDGRQQRAAFG